MNDWLALGVAALALLFTVGSFWYLHARQGELRSYEPHSFAAAVDGFAVLLLRFPMVLHNTGPKPIVVQDLQLRFPDEPTALIPLPWRTSRSELKPHEDDGPALPAPFAVAGHTAERHFIEFGGPFPGLSLKARDYRLQVEVRLAHTDGWTRLLDFTLRAGRITNPDRDLAYSNTPYEPTKEEKAKADAALAALMQRLGLAPDDGGPQPEGQGSA